MRHRIITATLFAAAAISTANWIDWALDPIQPYGHPFLLKVALAGSLLFLIACLLAVFANRYAALAGYAAMLLSWPYFALLGVSMPWKNFFWLVRIHEHGAAQVIAIVTCWLQPYIPRLSFGGLQDCYSEARFQRQEIQAEPYQEFLENRGQVASVVSKAQTRQPMCAIGTGAQQPEVPNPMLIAVRNVFRQSASTFASKAA